MRSTKQTIEQGYFERSDAQEFYRIQKFVAACRRQWPGAKIVLRSGGAQTGANAPPITPKLAPATGVDHASRF
jgi:hypothetical protein